MVITDISITQNIIPDENLDEELSYGGREGQWAFWGYQVPKQVQQYNE